MRFLFGLPSAAVGIVMGYLIVSSLLQWNAMRSWPRVPAKILSAELVTSHGSDSTTYRVTARYQYSFQGQSYTGSRVSLHSGSDNIGSFHQRTYRELAKHWDSEELFACYVNPENPSDAVLYKHLRWGFLCFYSFFFCCLGDLVIYSLACLPSTATNRKELKSN